MKASILHSVVAFVVGLLSLFTAGAACVQGAYPN